MALVIAGRQNKQIAAELGLSEVTVKVHRRQVMRASPLPALILMADRLAVSSRKS
jgi:FixJ family two-component response regulator